MPISKNDAVFLNNLEAETLQDVLDITAAIWVEKLRKSLEGNDRVSTGSTKSSIVSDIEIADGYIQFNIIGAKHIKFIDKGVSGTKNKFDTPYSFKKGFINKGAIKNYITNRRDKLDVLFNIVKFDEDLKSGKKRKTPLTDAKAYQSLEFILSKSIASKGLEPTHFVSEAITNEDISTLKKDISKQIKIQLLRK